MKKPHFPPTIRAFISHSNLAAVSPEKLTLFVSRAFLVRQYAGTARRPLIAFALPATLFAAAINISAIEFEENNGPALERDKSESICGTRRGRRICQVRRYRAYSIIAEITKRKHLSRSINEIMIKEKKNVKSFAD